MFRWYAIQTAKGREHKIKRDLQQRISNSGQDRFVRAIEVPTETVTVNENGKLTQKVQVRIPSYVLVNVDLPAVYSTIKNTKGARFLGVGDEPVPLTQAEVDKMLGRRGPGAAAPTVKSGPRFEPGEQVSITDGPFSGFTGTVRSCDDNGSTVTVEIEIFGRLTPATVSFSQVQSSRR